MTRIYARRDMHCPFSATIEFLEGLGTEQQVGPFFGVRARVQCEFRSVRDRTDEAIRHQALELNWKAPSRAPLPLMHGLITVRPAGPATELRMEGTYEPPFGLLGQWFDARIGSHIAQRTVDNFLRDLCDFVNRAWEADRLAHASPPHLP
jgi:hypothetical protein